MDDYPTMGRDAPKDPDPADADPADARLAGLEARAAGLGRPMTRLRRLTLGLLLEAGGPVKAYDLVERARGLGWRLTPASVYRVLEYLQEAGLVHKVNSLNAFVVCNEPAGTAHHPLIVVCPDCRRATEISDGRLAGALLSGLDDLGHGVEGATVEIQGLCRTCAAK
jgi:Fur family zinc uptake transcriptional regulator